MTWCGFTKRRPNTGHDFFVMDGERQIRIRVQLQFDGTVRVMAINEGWRPNAPSEYLEEKP